VGFSHNIQIKNRGFHLRYIIHR